MEILRIVVLTIVFVGVLILSNLVFALTEMPQLARLHYDGGGDWYNDPDALPNLVRYVNNTLNTNFSTVQAVVRPSDANLFDYPFIFMTGHGNITFSDREARNLRDYLLKGGFLYADDDYGMDEAFRREIRKVFPDRDMIELPANHPLFHCYFSFSQGIPKIHEHDGKRPQAFGIFDDTGRLMVLYTYETNISDGWSDAHDNPPEVSEEAFKMGTNMLYYIMTQ
ncbi:MAG: DUF4159 domain-containing protein [Candidatus Cloacimonetes bacterium]|nr:DUF4159 domain-containing protein [Candidatus Cloacimonadota bacterium]